MSGREVLQAIVDEGTREYGRWYRVTEAFYIEHGRAMSVLANLGFLRADNQMRLKLTKLGKAEVR